MIRRFVTYMGIDKELGDLGATLTNASVQFKFGVKPLPAEEDPALKTPCLAVCPTAASRASIRSVPNDSQCPQVTYLSKFQEYY